MFCSYFGLDHMNSFEIIRTGIVDCQFVSYYFNIQSQLPVARSCAYLSELTVTEFKVSIVSINGAVWSALCETR